MPGIFPRLAGILFSGFGSVTYLIAIICFMVGLLPKNHPCFSKKNRENYGLAKILAAAADNVKFEWKHIDQIVIFGVILCGTVMMTLYIAGLVLYLVLTPAHALVFSLSGLFQTHDPTNDIAFMMMDKVFGIPNLYNSIISQGGNFPNPFQMGLHELFRFYSMGIFFIALVIFLYHVVEFIFDVTQTGKVAEHLSDDVQEPYSPDPSKGFTWLPIRFVVCFGLLLPFGQGLNSAQWITLYIAKFGSNLATNAWIQYNVQTGDNPSGEGNINLVSRPSPMDNSDLMKALLMVRSCAVMNNLANNFSLGGKSVKGYVVIGSNNRPLFNDPNGGQVGFFDDPLNGGVYNASPMAIAQGVSGDNFIDILDYSKYSDIRIVIGEYVASDPQRYSQYPGGVLPVCGELTIPVTSRTGEGLFAAEGYLLAVMNVLFDVNRPGVGRTDEERAVSAALTREYTRTSSLLKDWQTRTYGDKTPDVVLDTYICGKKEILGNCKDPVPSSYWKAMMKEYYSHAFSVPTYAAYDFLAGTNTASSVSYYSPVSSTSFRGVGADNPLMISTGILKYGWGGAGIWYNKISERNGALYSAVTSVPVVGKLPLVMEKIKEGHKATDYKVSGGFCESFNPQKGGKTSSYLVGEKNQFMTEEAGALYNLCDQLFGSEVIAMEGGAFSAKTTNPILASIQSFFSEFRLFDVEQNREVTPMAQLSSIGKLLIDKAIIMVAGSAGAYLAGGMAHMSDSAQAETLGKSIGLIGDSIASFAMLGLVSGFILYYMLPLMPFVYFFFAVGRWVKVVFEALVGVPLWALAHMRVGGPGLPGSAASGGYFLLLEIFIRPIVTVFSLAISFALFSGLTVGLNSVFSLVTQNMFGAAPVGLSALSGLGGMTVDLTRGIVDQFFFSILYIVLVYMIGTGCFKLIDLVPDGIMRWSGAGVQAMGASDISDDLIDNWQWELPTRFIGMTGEIKDGIKEMFYEAPSKIGEAKRKEAAVKAAKEKQAAPKEKFENQQGDASE